MTKNYYTPINHADHSTFGGIVYDYDFDGYNSISDVAAHIASDMKFDEMCRKNIEQRNKQKNYKKKGS